MTLHSASLLAFEFTKKRGCGQPNTVLRIDLILCLVQFRQYYVTALWTSLRNNAQLLDAAGGYVQFGRP